MRSAVLSKLVEALAFFDGGIVSPLVIATSPVVCLNCSRVVELSLLSTLVGTCELCLEYDNRKREKVVAFWLVL